MRLPALAAGAAPASISHPVFGLTPGSVPLACDMACASTARPGVSVAFCPPLPDDDHPCFSAVVSAPGAEAGTGMPSAFVLAPGALAPEQDGMEDGMESETAAAPDSSSAALATFDATFDSTFDSIFSAFADSAKSCCVCCCVCCCSGAGSPCRWTLALSLSRSLLPAGPWGASCARREKQLLEARARRAAANSLHTGGFGKWAVSPSPIHVPFCRKHSRICPLLSRSYNICIVYGCMYVCMFIRMYVCVRVCMHRTHATNCENLHQKQ